MKKICDLLLCVMCVIVFVCGCSQESSSDVMKKGDKFSITGVVSYSNEPSDIGQEYCFVTTNDKIAYSYKDIYDEMSDWSSNVFYTRGDDTAVLRPYVGKNITVSGVFDAESHGIPYITKVTVE